TEHASRQRHESLQRLIDERNPGKVADMAATHVDLEHESRVTLLYEQSVNERLRQTLEFISEHVNRLEVQRDVDEQVRDTMSQHEREAMLRHKMRAIQYELDTETSDWLDELKLRLDARALSEEAETHVNRELERLEQMNPQSSEANVVRTYLEWVADLPWGSRDASEDIHDIDRARAQLEADHHGLDRVKRRVIEYLSVLKLAPKKRGPVLCFHGPPGTGKTSLARSIADSLGREFVRISLGGVRDASEVRGHRRTYVGALPGRLTQAMKQAGTSNPVILLDELDKLGGDDMRGDPASALLEALDPEQNTEFEDHYIALPYDLSRVIFIATANYLGQIPTVLRDRLEVIEITSYTVEEKLCIARDHLIPKLKQDHGLGERPLELTREALLELKLATRASPACVTCSAR
ncbi:MAG: AAA family ATPase, partial [Nannocystaceae bacterium]